MAQQNRMTATQKLKSFTKALLSVGRNPTRGFGGWGMTVQDPFPGAWQRNQELTVSDSTSYFAVYACVTLIASDIGKLPFLVKRQLSNGWWQTQRKSEYSWLNSEPNRYQTASKFREQWILSKLLNGNTYALKQRDTRGRVVGLYILDPTRVQVRVSSETGEVFYALSIDNLSQIDQEVVVPADEIIHDRMNCLFHPLVGISPLYAASWQALLGKLGSQNATNFFRNASNPGGILSAPGAIGQETVDELKSYFSNNFSGPNAGKIAVVGDGMKFDKLASTAQDSQLLQMLQWTAETICACFHVPAFMVIGTQPGSNAEVMTQQYYSQCLQALMNSMQECLDQGLDVGDDWAIELDMRELIRADTSTRVTSLTNAVKGSLMTINEARASEDLEPVEGGDTVWMQQQNYSLEALVERDKTNPLSEKPAENSVEKTPENQDPINPEVAVEAGTKVQDLAMNGAQVSSLLSILQQVSQGLLPLETARSIISAAFPTLSSETVNAMLDPLKDFTPPSDETKPVVKPDPVEEDPEPTEEEQDEEIKGLLDSIRKGLEIFYEG
jgi:HK97 family phage portal protein